MHLGAVLTLSLLASSIAVSTCIAAEQRPAHVGFLRAEAPDALFYSFRDGMRDEGYVEGRNLVIEQRWAYGRYDDLPRLARELVDRKVQVIFASCTPCTQAALGATRTIPIVTVSGNAVRMGFAESFSQPGGTVTGLTLVLEEISVKRLELLKEVAPRTSRVGVLWVATNPFWEDIIGRMKHDAPAIGLQIEVARVGGPSEIRGALDMLAHRAVDGLCVFEDPVLRGESAQIIAFASSHHLPVVYGGSEYARNGGLFSYGPSFDHLFKVAARYVAKILAGANPATMPLEQPTEYEFIVNLRTANAMGLKMPEAILLRATEVIR
jgi:putative ABC transport system substrate-binding protein